MADHESSPLLPTRSPHVVQSFSASRFAFNNAGLLLVATSQFFFSGMNICVKWLNSLDEPVPILQVIWVRMTTTALCCVAYMLWHKIPDPILGPKAVRRLLVLRGFSGFFGLFGLYSSLKYLSLSDATVLTFLAPILTGFSGAVFLKEPLSLREMLSGLCSFFGVVLIARPQFLFGCPKGDSSKTVTPQQRMLSVAAALVSVVGATATFEYTLLRAIGKRAHPVHSLTYFSFYCVLVSTIGMVISKIDPVIPKDVLWLGILFLVGIQGTIAQILLVMGLQRETASRGALALYTSIVFAIALEFIFFHTTPSAMSMTGATIIMSSAIYTSVISFSFHPKFMLMSRFAQLTKTTFKSTTLDRPLPGNDNDDPGS
ncbi:drug/metabolite transporter superfamily [Russula earlei]|uniref:Drug/metabolite transporter superfamily n=1 Tax=Russula earlei TaxID=71964 RepID=A0ACC0TZJ5_9AGAM|nr:drug/metabolite transporter superfamily [Russula earlei]